MSPLRRPASRGSPSAPGWPARRSSRPPSGSASAADPASGLVVGRAGAARVALLFDALLLLPVGHAIVGLEHGARRALLVGHREDVALGVVVERVAVLSRKRQRALRRMAHEGV